jgi:hypothetical protein
MTKKSRAAAALACALGALGCTRTVTESGRQFNTGITGSVWNVAQGAASYPTSPTPPPIVPNEFVVLEQPGQNIAEVVRPASETEVGLQSGPWHLSLLALVREKDANGQNGAPAPFSKNDLDVYFHCGKELGVFADIEAWKAYLQKGYSDERFGILTLNGETYLQFKLLDANWIVVSSATGKAFRISNLSGRFYGTSESVSVLERVNAKLRFEYKSVDGSSHGGADLSFDRVRPGDVSASCDGGKIMVDGLPGASSSAGWMSPLAASPFDFRIRLEEGQSL